MQMRRGVRRGVGAVAAAALLGAALGSQADVPFPSCASVACADPADFGSYLFLPEGRLPDDFDPAAGGSWKYNPETGMDVVGAWRITTGRPDVVVAVLDSGIRWAAPDVARKVALNAGELPPPAGCAAHDCNGDGFVSVDDYPLVPDSNGTGRVDGQDLIRFYSNGEDEDGNGFVDDIAGWDFADDDNDPEDVVEYGHGTGEAQDSTGEANNGAGFPGVAPNALFLPLKVADSFVAVGSDFAQAVVYAVDRGADVVQEALGALSASPTSQAAIDYAYRRGVPVVASAADESSRHHNLPAALEHTIWMNSIVEGDGFLVQQQDVFDLFNGCTNYGGRAWTAISSNSCSSEATGRGAGLVALLVSQGRNLMDQGLLSPYPGLDKPFSAEEVRQLLRASAEDVDHDGALDDISMDPFLAFVLSWPPLDLLFGSARVPTQAGWDQFTGYGRPNAARLVAVDPARIPPEADLSGSVRWFDTLDPLRRSRVPVRGSAAAVRTGGSFDWTLEVGCGVQPRAFEELAASSASEPLVGGLLAEWDIGATAGACGFDPREPIEDPDAHTVTLRLRVRDRLGTWGEDRRTVALHSDPTLHQPPIPLGTSGEASPALADVDRDGVLDVVVGLSDGRVRVFRGDTGAALDGFSARTDPLPVHPSPAWSHGEVPLPHETVLAPVAVDDLDGDGRVEVVAASMEGRVYVFDDHGRRRPGFPVRTDPTRSDPANRDRWNDTDPAILGGPTLVDLDPPGAEPALEIVAAAWDGHVYAWRADGSLVAGYPVRLADRSKVAVDPETGRATPRTGGVRDRAAKIAGSPAVGDLDGDGRPEIVVGTSEEYAGEPDAFAVESPLLALAIAAADELGDAFSFDTAGRVYALHPEGNTAARGPFVSGWPASVPLLAPGLLPTVGTGIPGAPALADVDASGDLAVAVFGMAGRALLLDGEGEPRLGAFGGRPRAFAVDFPTGFPNVPPTAGSADAPFFAALGSGAFGDITGDGRPEFVAPTAGLRKLLDTAGPASQAFSEHQVTAFDPRDGSVLSAFPRLMDDTQFLTSPALADVDGDGVADVLAGSGAYLLRAYRGDGSTPAGFPKFTHGWIIGSPAPGDVDGDGLIEVVATTREGHLYVWDTPAPARAGAIPWQGFGRDRRNTQNLDSGVSPLAAARQPLEGLVWELEAIQAELEALADTAAPALARALRRSVAPEALATALRLLSDGKGQAAAGLLPRVESGLSRPAELASLHAQLVAAVERATDRARAAAECAPRRSACLQRTARAARFDQEGDEAWAAGDPAAAVVSWSRALAFATGSPIHGEDPFGVGRPPANR